MFNNITATAEEAPLARGGLGQPKESDGVPMDELNTLHDEDDDSELL